MTDTTSGTFTFIFYLISPTTSRLSGDGFDDHQRRNVCGADHEPNHHSVARGDYEFGWSGTTTDEQDYAGQLTLASGTGNITGLVDLNDFATAKQTFDASVTGNLVLAGDGTGANTLTANVGTTPPASLTFTSYVVDLNTVLVVGIDTDRVIAGTLVRQP